MADSVAPPCLPALTLYVATSSTTGQSQFPTHVFTFTAIDNASGRVVFSNAEQEPKLEAGPVHLGYHKGMLEFLRRFPDILSDWLQADKEAGTQRDTMEILKELGRTRSLTVISAPGDTGIMFPYTIPVEQHIKSGFTGKKGELFSDAAWVAQVFLKAEEARVLFMVRAAETGLEKAQLSQLKRDSKRRYEQALSTVRETLVA